MTAEFALNNLQTARKPFVTHLQPNVGPGATRMKEKSVNLPCSRLAATRVGAGRERPYRRSATYECLATTSSGKVDEKAK